MFIVYCLFSLNLFLGLANSVLTKKFQLSVKKDWTYYVGQNMICAVFAMIYFAFICGFSIDLNAKTLWFSLIFAVSIIFNFFIHMIVLSHVSVSLSGITSTSGSMIISALFGVWFFNETITHTKLLSLLFILAAAILPYAVQLKKSDKRSNIFACVVLFLTAASSNIVQKFYTVADGVADTNSFFFATNMVMFLVCAVLLLVKAILTPEFSKELVHLFTPKQLGNIATRTVLSNISSIITILIISKTELSFFSILSSCFSIFSAGLISKFYFKESMTLVNWISIGLALCSILVNR